MSHTPGNSPARVLAASLIGTAIEFFDFYIYATAAVLVFPQLFFADPSTALLASMATFALAFIARPLGSALFGHFGDRVGRKATLVAALLTMGLSTVIIGLLPTYHQIGIFAPLLLALCRLGQGIGLGGEWGGAVLLATENAPPGKRAWYGMFPQLGAPIGFIFSGGIFLLLGATLTEEQFFRFGWRIPFLASALLVILGLWIRLKLEETPVFQKTLDKGERVKMPMAVVFRDHFRTLVLGTLLAILVFVLFYLMTVFTLGWGTSQLGYTRPQFLMMQIFGMLFFGAAIPLSAVLADKYGRRVTQIGAGIAIFLFGLVFSRLFHANDMVSTSIFLAIGLALMGLCYGPLGTTLSELFPTAVRYTGSSLTFNLAGIFGASLAPYIAFWLAPRYGLASVGWYLSAAAVISLGALWLTRETKDARL
jgi:metabolite-proton symporter